MPDLLHPFYADVAHGLSMALRQEGYFLIVASWERILSSKREIEQLLARRLDALVIASVCANAKAYQRITVQAVPYVLIDRRFPGDSGYFVGCDDIQIGFVATEHLTKMGCKRIAHIRGPETALATVVSKATGRRSRNTA